jgi:photosystem II stability/assembly factor-like uncharacterized protein
VIVCLSCNGGTVTAGESAATVLMVATVRGVHVFERSGPQQAWLLQRQTLADFHVSALCWESRSGLLFAGTHGNGGLWVSADRGQSWSPQMDGIEHRHIYTLAVQYRGDKTVLLAGTEPATLYRSDDLGRRWRSLSSLQAVEGSESWTFPPPPHVAHVKNIAFHPAEPETLYVCIEQGALLKSVDDGRTWIEEAGYASADDFFHNDNHRVLIKPSNSQALFMCGGEGLYASTDGGGHWEHLTGRDDRVGYPDAMFIDPRAEDVLYMAGPRFPPRRWGENRVADPTVLCSPDSGRSWKEIREGLPSPIVGNIEAMGLYQWGDHVMLVAGTATGEVFACEEAGEAWQKVADDLPPISKGGHYRWFLPPGERGRIEGRMRAGG